MNRPPAANDLRPPAPTGPTAAYRVDHAAKPVRKDLPAMGRQHSKMTNSFQA